MTRELNCRHFLLVKMWFYSLWFYRIVMFFVFCTRSHCTQMTHLFFYSNVLYFLRMCILIADHYSDLGAMSYADTRAPSDTPLFHRANGISIRSCSIFWSMLSTTSAILYLLLVLLARCRWLAVAMQLKQ